MTDTHPELEFKLRQGTSLGSTLPPRQIGHFEITINHPRNKGFINLLSHKQKQYLYSIFQIVIKHFGDSYKNSDHVFEMCQDGQIHLHGWIEIELELIIPGILVNDIAKIYKKCFPKKYQNYNPKNYYENYKRYRDPSLVVQYQDKPREAWLEYLKKAPV